MSLIKDIFVNERLHTKVHDVYRSCSCYMDEYCESVGKSEASLFTALIRPDKPPTKEKYKEILSFWKEALTDGEIPQFNKLGVYSNPQISQKISIFQSLLEIRDDSDLRKILYSTEPSVQDLNIISYKLKSPTAVLALKYLWFYLRVTNNQKTYHPKHYTGMPPMTDPVQKACKVLFNRKFQGDEAKDLHVELAKETGMDEVYINTALWVKGISL